MPAETFTLMDSTVYSITSATPGASIAVSINDLGDPMPYDGPFTFPYAGEVEIEATASHMYSLAGPSMTVKSYYQLERPFPQAATEKLCPAPHLESPEGANATFVPNTVGLYKLQFTVSDGCATYTDTVTVDASCPAAPVAHAGMPQVSQWLPLETRFEAVTLSGTMSTDGGASAGFASNDAMKYTWTIVSQPELSQLTFHSDEPMPVFVPDEHGDYVLQLEVSNGCASTTDTVVVSTSCPEETLTAVTSMPVTVWNAGGIWPVVTVMGNSSDAHASALYSWVVESAPYGSTAADPVSITSDDSVVTFQPDVEGVFSLRLTVTDACSASTASTNITAACSDAPVVDAGDDYVVYAGNALFHRFTDVKRVKVQLNGTVEDNGNVVRKHWKFIQWPHDHNDGGLPDGCSGADTSRTFFVNDAIHCNESHATIFNRAHPHTAYFYPDAVGTYVMQLTAEGECATRVDVKQVDVRCNAAPVVDAGTAGRWFCQTTVAPPLPSSHPSHSHTCRRQQGGHPGPAERLLLGCVGRLCVARP